MFLSKTRSVRKDGLLSGALYTNDCSTEHPAEIRRKIIYGTCPTAVFFWWATFHFFAIQTPASPTSICDCPYIPSGCATAAATPEATGRPLDFSRGEEGNQRALGLPCLSPGSELLHEVGLKAAGMTFF